MGKGIFVISGKVENEVEKLTVGLDEALDIVGLGWYNIKYCLLFAGFLIAVIMETTGYSYILPASKCDLGMNDEQRGLLYSLPFIGIVLTSHLWGYMADTRGRKPVILFTSFTVGIVGALALFMPEIYSFAVVKFIASFFLACPAGISYALIGEMVPARYCDTALSVVNATMILGSAAIPLLAWLILRWDFYIDFGIYVFRPWRLLGMAYSLSLVVCALFMLTAPESPKYLVAKGKMDEALAVLQKMYAGNTGKNPEDFPVVAIRTTSKIETEKQSLLQSLTTQTVPLFKPPYLKWMALNSFLLFGMMGTLNGLFMWVPDVLNRVLSGDAGAGSTACQVIGARLNSTMVIEEICDDYIETSTIMINSIANACAAAVSIVAGISVQFIGKKTLLIGMYLLIGLACIAINYVTNTIVFAVLLSSIQLTAIGIGPINAYSVAIFPTHLRGMAVSLSIMFGRFGSVLGTNVAGVLINASCESTFFGFGGLLLLCGLLSFLLPSSNNKKK